MAILAEISTKKNAVLLVHTNAGGKSLTAVVMNPIGLQRCMPGGGVTVMLDHMHA